MMARALSVILQEAKYQGRRKLLEHESFQLCEAYGIPVPKYGLARSSVEAVEIAKRIGFPVALKVVSPDIVHKSDVGGVVLDADTPEKVVDGYNRILRSVAVRSPGARIHGVLVQEMVPRGLEVIVGGTRDPYFGPVVLFGVGGVFVEALKDVSVRVAPLTPVDAEDMIREIKGYALFENFRGQGPRDKAAVADILLRVSRLLLENPEIAEVDLNPVIVFEEGLGAKVADARFIIG